MNGYSKMRPSNKKTRSMDFSDLLSSSSSSSSSPPPQTQEITIENSSTSLQSPERNKGGREELSSSSSSSSVVVLKNQSQRRDSSPKVVEEVEEERDASPGSNMVGAVKLTRTCSVAPANYYSSSRFRLERQSNNSSRSRRTRSPPPPSSSSGSIQSAVKRVFSMRRSSSVSEKYCRIYDPQRAELEPAAFDDDDDKDAGAAANADNSIIAMKTRSMKTDKKNGILKACKRLLGF